MSQQTINLREILHDFALTYRVESRDTRKQDIDKASTAILKLIKEMVPEAGQCQSPIHIPEQRVSLDMAIDAGDRELEGALFSQESFQECGECVACIKNQCRQTFLDRLEEMEKR